MRFADADEQRRARELAESEERPFDFERLIPMPEAIGAPLEARPYEAMAWYLTDGGSRPLSEGDARYFERAVGDDAGIWLERAREAVLAEPGAEAGMRAIGERLVGNVDLYGEKDWYDWSCANWGTKWNAREDASWSEDPDDPYVDFETAWAPPFGVVGELSRRLGTPLRMDSLIDDDGVHFFEVDGMAGDAMVREVAKPVPMVDIMNGFDDEPVADAASAYGFDDGGFGDVDDGRSGEYDDIPF